MRTSVAAGTGKPPQAASPGEELPGQHGILSRFPRRSLIWGAIILLSIVAITAMLYTVPAVALQYWYLYQTPLIIAAFVFGLRGALAGAIVTIVCLTLLYFSSMSVYAHLTEVFRPVLQVAGGGDVRTAFQQLVAMSAYDPRTAAAHAGGGMIATLLSSVFFGILADRGRQQERLALRRATEQLTRYFSPQLVASIVSGDGMRELTTARKEVTVLFADLRGFTALTERLEPEELGAILNTYLSEMTEVIFKYDGTLDKYIGDAVMAFFGDPVTHGDDPERAIRAAVEMRERFQRLRSTWATEGRESVHIGIGVNTGYATVGNVGSQARMEYTVIGSSVNVGARLADAARPGQILVSQRTLAAARHVVEWRNVGSLELQGVPYPVDTVEILGLRLLARESEASTEASALDLVLSRTTEDFEFRAALMSHPEDVLTPYGLNPQKRALATELATLLGYPVFRGVAGEGVVQLVHAARLERYDRGTTIVRQGDRAAQLYLIARGEVGVYRTDEQNRERHVATLGRGGHFGEMGVSLGMPRNATVVATTDVELYVLDEAAYHRLEQTAPELMQNILLEATRRDFSSAQASSLPL